MLKIFYRLIYTAFILLVAKHSNAQTCTGSLGAPVVNETFGSGTASGAGPPLAAGITNLQYLPSACAAEDGQYSITTSLGSGCKGGTWQVIGRDHTGDPFGYFMVINASVQPNIFYTQRVAGSQLCPNTTYEFAAWIMNILVKLPSTTTYSQPDITFSIEKADGTVLKTYRTGQLPFDRNPDWHQYGTFFTSPADGADVIVKMLNNGQGGNGNDLALDDITFRPCGPLIQTGFGTVTDTASRQNCAGDNLNYTLAAQQTGYTSPVYQWQQNFNGKEWVNIAGQTSASLPVILSQTPVGKYQYRVGILNTIQGGSSQCTIYSDPLTINISPYPVTNLSAVTNGCIGYPLMLSSTGGDTYSWTGPNGFTSALPSPVIPNATPADNGVYTVQVLNHGCPIFSSTTVTIAPKPTVNPMADVSYCGGSGGSAQLHAVATNASHYKWHPSAGLDHDDIASPVANPAVTTLYVVEVYSDGCPDVRPSSAVTVNVLTPPLADAGSAIKMFEGKKSTLNGAVSGDSITRSYWTPLEYLDDPNSLMPTTSAVKDITYTLHVISASCGEATSSVFVRVYNKLNVFNTFTPNGDGVNDFWNITNLTTYPNAVITVYDRQGQKVYTSKGYSTPWDGMYAGSLLPTGTYYYIIDFKEDNLPRVSGWVFIVR